MKKNKKLTNIIEALGQHEDVESISVLNELGTNCPMDDVRRLTAKALVNKNSREALNLVILEKGKGINDLSTSVAMSTINELLALKDKTEVMKILSEAEQNHSDSEVKETARSVSALMAFTS